MLTKRIIPCLDIQNGRTVKGTNFLDLRDAGDPVELGARYAAGRGVAQDYVAAHVWLDLAAFRARGPLREQYSAERDGVARKLTPEQAAEAKRRALELKTKWAR